MEWFLPFSSCLHPPLTAGLWSGQSGRSSVAQDCRFFVFVFFFVTTTLPRSEPGAIWVYWLLRLSYRTVTSCFVFFGGIILPCPPRQGCRATSVFRFSIDALSPRPPFSGDMTMDCFAFFLSLADRPPFYPFSLAFLVGFIVLPFRGGGVSCEESHLRLIF